ncbi:hypothetical protein [Silvimonas amylolytica]|uniref:Uncharacterized protein n=1 Tax=Silvimonas amylolytica TaxID=449663 RepID=A0ABQ2PH75_9NEIS|nr:hypothetical protein [Silvimonas amylolytica]GGP24663.1 hypothetical protein GCM10010971_04820 [Silvimonas amylolytica]
MPFNWLAAVQAIPWGQVIDNTPKLIEATRKLFTRSSQPLPPEPVPPSGLSVSDKEAWLEQQLAQTRAELADLQHDLQESVRLINGLAEQNAQMVLAIERLRIRTRWFGLMAASALAGVLGLALFGRLH